MDYIREPAWYVLMCAKWDYIKHGTTYHLSKRKDPFFTCGADPVQFQHCFLLDPLSLKVAGIDSLYRLDSHHFPKWLRQKGHPTALTRGGGTEFYQHADPVLIARNFLTDMGIKIRSELTSDPFPYPSTHYKRRDADLMEEDDKKEEANSAALKPMTKSEFLAITKEQFLTALGYKALRRIQDEVWDRWTIILATQPHYKGIVQWPTGTGKTIAELILILLCADHVKRSGGIYRGLLIAPKNDILNTQMDTINMLKKFGIEVIEAHNGKFSSTEFPTDKHCLIVVTHAALAQKPEPAEGRENEVDVLADVLAGMDRLPTITHIHYDEVHRATGKQFFEALTRKRAEWGDPWFTGTSATPKTAEKGQHERLAAIFGDPFTTLHRCEVDEAVREGWIASPRFYITQINDGDVQVQVLAVVRQTVCLMLERIARNMCEGGKAIVYFNTKREVTIAYALAKDEFPEEWKIYKAVDSDATDEDFASEIAKPDGTPRILFACDKYREGSDIKGLEFTAVLMGHQIAAYILLQIIGRALRTDYAGKEGWCCIIRPKFDGETADDVLLHVLLDLEAMISLNPAGTTTTRAVVEKFVRTYFGTITLDGKAMDVAETVERTQNLYLRREYDARSAKEKYFVIRDINKSLVLQSRDEYARRCSEHPRYIPDPKSYFKESWVSWYHFLGVDVTAFPQTKTDWVRVCKEMQLNTWEEYKAKNVVELPPNPGEMYDEYTNWNKEFGGNEEIVW